MSWKFKYTYKSWSTPEHTAKQEAERQIKMENTFTVLESDKN